MQKANKIHYYYIYTIDLLMTLKASKIHYYYICTTDLLMTQKANKIHYYYIYTIDLLMTQKANKIHYYYIYTIDLLMTLKASKICYYYICKTDLLTQKANKIHYYYIDLYNRPVDDPESQQDPLLLYLYKRPVDDPESQQDTLLLYIQWTCWWPRKPARHTTIYIYWYRPVDDLESQKDTLLLYRPVSTAVTIQCNNWTGHMFSATLPSWSVTHAASQILHKFCWSLDLTVCQPYMITLRWITVRILLVLH